jgi:hypothetical protein
MSDIPYGFEKPIAKRLRDTVRGSGEIIGQDDQLPEQRRVAIARAPSSGIPARSGTTPGTASCTFLEIATGPTLATTTISETVYNVSGLAVEANSYIFVNREYVSGKWVIVMESCEPE